MKLYPRNRHILIELLEQEKDENETRILLPENYSEKKEPYISARVREVAPSCTTNVAKGDIVVVESSMVQELKVGEELFIVVLENYIYGVISNR